MNENLVTIEQVKENFDLLDVKQYLPFAFKKGMIDNIIETCTSVDDNGILHIDSCLKQMAMEFTLINHYTNLELNNDNIFETYDLLKESGIIKDVYKNIPDEEIQFIEKCLNEQLDYLYRINNSIEVFVAKGIKQIIEKFPSEKSIAKLMKDIPKQINKIDPNKLKYVTEAIGWNNGINKTK